jgi:alpha-beta hydrolase superfamily lysophospholipase
MNIVAFFHAYKFTHFATENLTKTKCPEKLNSFDKIKTLFFGVNNPRPTNKEKPNNYIDIKLQSNMLIDCWYLNKSNSIKVDTTLGTVILFHGYSGEKSSMLDKAKEFEKMNYNVLLVDFMGSGGSEGNQTTLGFKEAEEVKTAFEYLKKNRVKNIYLFGTSMGSVAIMKAMGDYDLKAKGIIIECPFGSMYQTTCARFKIMNAPTFPMAGLLVFWGGVQNSFWAFGHNPTEYAKKINCPTLLLYGEQDKNVSRQEINDIYANLNGKKILKTYKLAGHENFLIKYEEEWIKDIADFLSTK